MDKNFQPIEVKVGFLALNTWFVGQIISVFVRPTISAGLGEWMTSIAAFVLVMAGLSRTISGWSFFAPAHQRYVLLGTAILLPMLAQGLWKGMDDPLYTALQSIPWLAAIYVPALGSPDLRPIWIKTFRWHAFLGVAVSLFVLSDNWSLLSAESIKREETLGVKVFQFLLYSLFFQFFKLSDESWIHRFVVLLGLAQMLVIAFASGTRQPLLLLSLVMLIGFWCNYRARFDLIKSGITKALSLLAVILFVSAVIYYIYSNMIGAVDLLERRLLSESSGTSLRDNTRKYEIQQLLDQFEPVDYVFGRGVRGEFVNDAAPKQDNVHIGWFRTLLKGGLPMVMLLLFFYVLCALRAVFRERDPNRLAAAAVVLYFGVKNSTGNIILANGHFYIVAICAGTLLVPRRPLWISHHANTMVRK